MSTIVICGALAATPSLRAETLPFIVPTDSAGPPTCARSLEQCDFALKTALAEIEARKATDQLKDDYIEKLTVQRDKAYQAAEPGFGLPWWIWTTFGAAAATVVIKGIR